MYLLLLPITTSFVQMSPRLSGKTRFCMFGPVAAGVGADYYYYGSGDDYDGYADEEETVYAIRIGLIGVAMFQDGSAKLAGTISTS